MKLAWSDEGFWVDVDEAPAHEDDGKEVFPEVYMPDDVNVEFTRLREELAAAKADTEGMTELWRGEQRAYEKQKNRADAAEARIAELEAHNKTLQSTWEHGVRRRQELKSLLNQCARQIEVWMVSGKLERRNHAAAKALIDLIELRIERGE